MKDDLAAILDDLKAPIDYKGIEVLVESMCNGRSSTKQKSAAVHKITSALEKVAKEVESLRKYVIGIYNDTVLDEPAAYENFTKAVKEIYGTDSGLDAIKDDLYYELSYLLENLANIKGSKLSNDELQKVMGKVKKIVQKSLNDYKKRTKEKLNQKHTDGLWRMGKAVEVSTDLLNEWPPV